MFKLKKKNPGFSNIDAVDRFYWFRKFIKKLVVENFMMNWFEELKKIILLIKKQKRKFQKKQLKLLNIQKDMMIKQLIQFPELILCKKSFPFRNFSKSF